MARYQPPTEWQEWEEFLAAALHGRNRWRLAGVISGILFARGRRTVTTWLRAAGIDTDFANYYYFLQPLGRKAKELSGRLVALVLTRLARLIPCKRLLLAVDDTPTKRYGPKVQGAGIHHNPTPGPADQKFLYGHIWVTTSFIFRHPLWQTIGLPLLGMMYVRAKDIAKIPAHYHWEFRTKLQLAVEQVLHVAKLVMAAGKAVWVVADGAFAKAPFLKPLRAAGVIVVSRLRKDAALFDVPDVSKTRGRGRPRKYGTKRIHLARRGAHPLGWQTIECVVYGKLVTKTMKTFLATYRPASGLIRVVIVKEEGRREYFFCTNPDATPREVIEAFADRASIEQDFHDVKEVWGVGQQQVRNIWSNIAVFNLNLWVHTLVEMWAWDKPVEAIRDRSASPWDDPNRRPSHADRRKALLREILQNQYSQLSVTHRRSSKIRRIFELLLQLAA